ncbi:MAG: SpoIID/LytB domain-containing protein [Lachnospiraceae bacterium]
MKERLKIIISCALILICLPYLITYFFQGEETKAVANDENSNKIAGILASQVPVTVETEALKAQAVIVRTQLLWAEENDGEEAKPLSKQEMEQLWGQEKYYEFYEKMIKAAEDTDGQVMTFENKVINPSFHKVSAGMTRDGSQIYKDTPYLLSVNSKSDILSEDYLTVQFFTRKEFEDKAAKLVSTENKKEKKEQTLEEYLDSITLKTDGAGYVTEIKIDGENVDVDSFVKVFELSSSCFSMKEMDEHIRIVTKGCGHGFGLSQYGANEMAKDKKSYEEILKYYFSGIKIEKTGKH